MKILLIAATSLEMENFIENNPDIEVLITGVGTISTVYHLQKQLQRSSYDLIIQAGIAGSFTHKYNLGEVVLVLQDGFGDIGAEEKGNFITIFEMGLADKDVFPFDGGWLVNKNAYLTKSLLQKVTSVTINKVSDSILQKKQLIDKYNADTESMEGAALHYVCLQEKIPFIQIRSISNYVGERDKNKWKMKDAISNLHTELIKLLKEITDN